LTELIRFNATLNRSVIPVLDVPQLIFVLAELVPAQNTPAERLPINFCLVLDRSGSMMGEKLRTMKEAVKSVIDQLASDDILSIVTFESRPEILVASQTVGDKKVLKQLVDKIQDGGGTNVAEALRASLKLVLENHRENEVRRIILLTDGEATDRQQDSFDLADEAGLLGIPILCLGFGEDWNVDFLLEIADRSILALPGSHIGFANYIPSPDDAVKIFLDTYRSMKVVAQDAVVGMQTASGVDVRRIWQTTPNIQEVTTAVADGRLINLPVGLLDESGAAFLAEILVPPRLAGSVRIVQLHASYHLPGMEIVRQDVDLVVEYSADPVSAASVNEHVTSFVEKVQAYKLQSQALEEAESGDLGSATRKLRQAVTILLSHGEDQLAKQITLEADQLEQTGVISSKGKKTILLTSRKTIRLSD
jgi:Ca-activated chloride channel homolog